MVRIRPIAIFLGISTVALIGVYAADDALSIEHADCPFFGASHDKIVQGAMRGFRSGRLVRVAGSQAESRDYAASALTQAVASALSTPPPGTRTGTLADPASSNTIDRYLFPAMAQANVTPAPLTTDYEFVRRVTLDLTGRIPAADQVTSFVADTSPNKRAAYIDTLLSSPQWV